MGKVRAIIQARMGSKRLRGKSLLPISGKPLLYRVVDTARQLPFIDDIMIATTDFEEDLPIVALAKEYNVKCFRGDALNVLMRYIDASSDLGDDDMVVRLTADNPFNWIEVSESLYEVHKEGGYDYTCIEGLSHIVCEIVNVGVLRSISSNEAVDDFDREHVTAYIRKNRGKYKIKELPGNFMGIRHDLDKFLTIDTYEDLHRIEKMINDLGLLSGRIPFKLVYHWLDRNKLGEENDYQFGHVVNLSGVPVGEKTNPYMIAEIGQNHNGDMYIAKKLIDMAARCQVNAVKFQKRDVKSELTKAGYERLYDNHNSFGETYGEHREFLELGKDQHSELKEYATARGITYFCTPCDIPSLKDMEEIGCPFYKIASRDLTNIPLLEEVGKVNKPVIISTGMASYEDIEDGIRALNLPPDKLIIMQCTSEYPCELENVNLRVIGTLRRKYGYLVGLSDHTSGIITSVAAMVMGACIIEKHITLNRAMKGTDHPGSLEESGLKKLVDYLSATKISMGDEDKVVLKVTNFAKNKLAKSITSKVKIKKGTILDDSMICLKSPGNGILWREKKMIIGKKAKKDIDEDLTLFENDFE